jgi:hypothetical protein
MVKNAPIEKRPHHWLILVTIVQGWGEIFDKSYSAERKEHLVAATSGGDFRLSGPTFEIS